MYQVQKHLELLGKKAEDKVTGFKGVVSTISFDLYGCIQVVISPPIGKEGDHQNGRWFDIYRLKVTGKKPVMDVPDFAVGEISKGMKGPAEKPLPSSV